MCGIAGALDLCGQREFPRGRLRAMLRAIAHRGPDDEHAHVEPGVALGARRLSIVDLEGGRQPLSNEDGSVWVGFNGELFEYPELREGLLARGHRLATRCDTEAWVHLYEDHGDAVFEHARGQFATSLWDHNRRTLLLGRDRMGICPLYYAAADGWLLWGSEIKSLLASGLVQPRADVRAIDYFFHTYAAAPERTFFEGVKAVPPGHFLRVRDGRVSLHQYWELEYPDAGQERRSEDPTPLVDELEEHLRKAVERRLRGDVPVVSYLSGGLDSAVVLSLSSRERGHAVRSFSIALDQAGPDERADAAETAAHVGSSLTSVELGREPIGQAYPELVRAAEMPVLDTSCACLLRLAQAVHGQGYKVALTGEGADEALAGYFWFKGQKIRTGIRRTAAGRWLTRRIRDFTLRSIGGGPTHRPPREPVRGLRTAQMDVYDLLTQSRERLYDDGLWSRLDGYEAYDDLNRFVHPEIGRWHWLNQSLYVGYKVHLTGLLLHAKGDRIAMNASVETRYPFLDDNVIAFCAGIAPEYKLRGLTHDKWILRRVAERSLPKAIAARPKTMFQASRGETFLGTGRPEWVDQLLSPESLRATGYFDPDAIAGERAAHLGRSRLSMRRVALDLGLTCAVATQLWHHVYCGGGLCDLPYWSSPRDGDQDATSGPLAALGGVPAGFVPGAW